MVQPEFNLPTRGFIFDTLPTCASLYYYFVTHLPFRCYSNTFFIKNKTQNRSNTPLSPKVKQFQAYVAKTRHENLVFGCAKAVQSLDEDVVCLINLERPIRFSLSHLHSMVQQFHFLSPQIHNHNTTTFPTSNPANSSFHFLTSFPQIPTSYYCSQTQPLRFQILFFFLPLHSYNSNNKLFFSRRPILNRSVSKQ